MGEHIFGFVRARLRTWIGAVLRLRCERVWDDVEVVYAVYLWCGIGV